MEHFTFILALFATLFCLTYSVELTFELPDNEHQCFFESIEKGTKSTIEFQVITGGHYDVDMELTAPSGQVLYKDVKKQYDSFTWTADASGIYKFCFGNEFSTFSHKVVYFDLQVGDEKPLMEGMDSQAKAMTLMETSVQNVHEDFKTAIDYQTHFRLRELQGRSFAEDLNERVMYWSIGQSVVIVLIGIGQVMVLQSFFTDKHKTPSAT
ncbi:hypothetical protein LOTGIDRAFT_172331 [Lottia gigantea]|uniref:GOLD domain-containing protein n=1 Tax=Lottia gigantea TaxID=225164 RepID=V4CI99_LOTGI|nr:hypothetical protein LOTGIDRAFT_172331 [Lottia gigantea]ESP01865.1 hypothetical protein LOTGIDRAFT_172331 [Lottia gigantea]